MRLHTQTPLYSFAIGLISLMGISSNISFIAAANAQSFPNDGQVTPSNATQYLVYLPSVANIKRAKVLAPDAFVSRLDTGEQVVQLGRFNNLNLAERRVTQFAQAGLSAQIKPVQSRFASIPSPSSIPAIPSSNPLPNTAAPFPVEVIPNSTVRNEVLPGVPNSGFPNTNPQNNSIEIVRSPQSMPQQNQPNSQQIPAISNQSTSDTSQLRYFVVIPTSLTSELQRVQAIAPNAQLRSSYRGTYIEVQGFPDRTSAETLNLTVRRQGFDSRVVFF